MAGTGNDYVFQVGFNKCATTALFELFMRSGYRCLHSSGRRYRLKGEAEITVRHPQVTIHHNLIAGLPPISGVENFHCYVDMEYDRPKENIKIENFKFFDRFARAYPNAKFILNTRNKENWLRSRARHNDGKYLARSALRLNLSQEGVLQHWADDYDRHNDNVREFFAQEADRLLEFHTEKDPIEKLIGFCIRAGLKLDRNNWGKTRVTPNKAQEAVAA